MLRQIKKTLYNYMIQHLDTFCMIFEFNNYKNLIKRPFKKTLTVMFSLTLIRLFKIHCLRNIAVGLSNLKYVAFLSQNN
jgi:hypothetical protein